MATPIIDLNDRTKDRIIPRDLFHAEKKVLRDHAISYNVTCNLGLQLDDNTGLDNLKDIIVDIRNRFKDYIQSALEDDIKKECNNQNITYNGQPITKVKNLGKAWADDAALAQQVWDVLYGKYRKKVDWDTQMEKEAMDCLKYKYAEAGGGNKVGTDKRGNKGCVAKLATKIKRDLMKAINRHCRKTHGKKVSSGRETNIIGIDSKGRKKYQRHKGKQLTFEPEKHIIQVSVTSMPKFNSITSN